MASKKTYNCIDLKEQLLLIENKKSENGGYKQELLASRLSEIELEYYVCTKCDGLMRNACQIGDEQTPVCESCAGKEENPQPMAKSRKKIPELSAKCPLDKRGCVWKGKMREVESHLDVCPEFLVNCTNVCSVILKRSEMKNHCENECQCREINCSYCKSVIMFKEEENHTKTCPDFHLICPNGCGKSIIRKDLNLHSENDCPNALVECTYKRMGCNDKMTRSQREKHTENSASKHLELSALYAVNKVEQMEIKVGKTEEENTKLSKKNEELTARVKFLEDKLRGLEIKMDKIAFPVVLKDEISDKLIKHIEKESFFEPASCHNFWPNQIKFRLNFLYQKSNKLIVANLKIFLGKDKLMFLKWPFRARFRLTILDRENVESSLVKESKEQELQPKDIAESSPKDEITVAEIPGALLLEKRFRNPNNSVTFLLQMQETH